MTIRRVPPRLDELLDSTIEEVGEELQGAWTGYTNSRDAVVFALFPTQCRVTWSHKGKETWRRDQVRISVDPAGRALAIETGQGKPFRMSFQHPETLTEIGAVVNRPTGDGPGAAAAGSGGPGRVVTLHEFPGHSIEQVHGIVTGIGSLAGWTAAAKGRGALEKAFPEILQSAERLGANAVVGVQASTFAAGGGITNMMGGDAVGVLLIGTAVTVLPRTPVEPGGTP